MNSKISENKNIFYTILFYVVSIPIVIGFFLIDEFKTGLGGPGLDLISAFFVVVFNIILLIATAISTFVLKKKIINLFFIHFFIFLIWTIYILIMVVISK